MSSSNNSSNNNNNNNNEKPLTIGVFGGSFNPIHLGHALLAITTQQTMPVDGLVLVPVYKHAVKRDLLPFDDRVNMCKLAVAPFSSQQDEQNNGITVSTIERDVGESNGAMLRALKKQYPPHTKLLWICGDDFFRWWQRPKGLETLHEVDGLIVQRRLHKQQDSVDAFFKEPLNETEIRAIACKLSKSIDFIYGELPHFSSTLVRRAPGTWKSFLPQTVTKYLEERPHLLQQLHDNLESDVKKEAEMNTTTSVSTGKRSREQQEEENAVSSCTSDDNDSFAALSVMKGLGLVHALQMERGRTGLWLSIGSESTQQELQQAQANTDSLIQEFLDLQKDNTTTNNTNDDEVMALAAELQQVPIWLERDRVVVKRHKSELVGIAGIQGWSRRLSLVEKYNPRIDVLIGSCIRAFQEILDKSNTSSSSNSRDVSNLLFKWSQGKEALGRLRAFVCAGGPEAPSIVRESLEMRELLHNMIDRKEKSVARVLSLQASSQTTTRLAAPDALHKLLEQVTQWEWALMGCFASSTPLPLVHKLLSSNESSSNTRASLSKFDVESFFYASSAALDLMLTFVKALAASGCARA